MYTVEAQEKKKKYFNAQMVDAVVTAAARFTGLRHLISRKFSIIQF